MENLVIDEIVEEPTGKSGKLILGGIIVTAVTVTTVLAVKLFKKIKNKKKNNVEIQETKTDEEIFENIDEEI